MKSTSYKYFSVAIILTTMATYLLFILPHKGFDFTDHGYALYNARMLTQDKIPVVGYGALFNTFFMSMGIKSYLFFERLFLVMTAISIGIFANSLGLLKNNNGYNYILFTLLIITSINLSVSNLINYQTATQISLLLALAILFKAKDSNSKLLLATSAAIFAFSTMTNLSLLPTAASTLILCAIYLRNKHSILLFSINYAIVFGCLFYLYLHTSTNVFNQINYSQMSPVTQSKTSYFFSNIHHIIVILLEKIMIPTLIMGLIARTILWKKYASTNKAKYYTYMSIVFLLGQVILIAYFTHHYNPFSFSNSYDYESTLQNIEVLNVNFLILAIILLIDKTTFSLRLTIASLLVLSYGTCLAITSGPMSHIALISGSSLVIYSLLLKRNIDLSLTRYVAKLKALQISLLVILLAFTAYNYFKYNYRSGFHSDNKYQITNGPLHGIYVDKQKLQSLKAINEFYMANDCSSKALLAYSSLPLLYYIYDKDAPYDHQWLGNTMMFTSSTQLINYLRQNKHFCVIRSPKFNGQIDSTYDKKIATYLKNNSLTTTHMNILQINDDSPVNFTFYSS